jgi:hypothetical protein
MKAWKKYNTRMKAWDKFFNRMHLIFNLIGLIILIKIMTFSIPLGILMGIFFFYTLKPYKIFGKVLNKALKKLFSPAK